MSFACDIKCTHCGLKILIEAPKRKRPFLVTNKIDRCTFQHEIDKEWCVFVRFNVKALCSFKRVWKGVSLYAHAHTYHYCQNSWLIILKTIFIRIQTLKNTFFLSVFFYLNTIDLVLTLQLSDYLYTSIYNKKKLIVFFKYIYIVIKLKKIKNYENQFCYYIMWHVYLIPI